MHQILSLALLSSLALACSGGDDDGGGSVADAALANDTEPSSGAWDYSEFTTVSSTCGTLPASQPSDGFTLLNNGDSSFTVTSGDGTAPFDCTISGSRYICPDAPPSQGEAGGTTITGTGAVTGTFSSATSATGARAMDVTCTGAGCASFGATFPCQLEVSYNVTLAAAP